jgi:hypothetical protein
MALGSTQSLTEMSTRCISSSKGRRCVRLTTLPPSCAVVMKSGNLHFLEPSGPLQACNGTALPLPLLFHRKNGCTNALQCCAIRTLSGYNRDYECLTYMYSASYCTSLFIYQQFLHSIYKLMTFEL